MASKLKKIAIFLGIGLVLVVLYSVVFQKKEETPDLLTTGVDQEQPSTEALPKENSEIAKEFLAELLSIKSLQLDDSILSGIAFSSLRDPDVLIIQDEQEGRPNPFAPIGFGAVAAPKETTSTTPPADTTPPTGGTTPAPTSTTPPSSTTTTPAPTTGQPSKPAN
jgi:hypothetical protein